MKFRRFSASAASVVAARLFQRLRQQLQRFRIAPADLLVALQLGDRRRLVVLGEVGLGQDLVHAVLFDVVGIHVADRGALFDDGVPILGLATFRPATSALFFHSSKCSTAFLVSAST